LCGSIHSCVDFLLLARVIFVSFLSYFRRNFVRRSIRQFEGVSLRISLRGSWVSALCLFVDDLDPSNARFGLLFVDFRMNPSS
jgi:hypothetical protein